MKKSLAILMAMALVFVGAGCSQAGDGTTAAPESGQPVQESEASTPAETPATGGETKAAPEDGKVLKIGMSIPVASAVYWTGAGYGVQKAVEELNAEAGKTVVEFQFFDPGAFDLQTQLKNIEDAMALDFDGMVIAPVDADGTVNAIDMAYEDGMPIFTIDLDANTDAILAGFCTFNYNAGCTNAETMAELIKEKNGAYEGKVAMVMGYATVSSHMARCQGFRETMEAKYPDIEIVFEEFSGKPEEDLRVSENALAMYGKDLDGIFVTGDTAANSACQAAEDAGLMKPVGDPEHIIIVGFDGEAQGIENIRAGRQDATVAQNPIAMGYNATMALVDYLRTGVEPKTDTEDRLIEVAHMAITKENLDTAEAQEFLWADIVSKADLDF